MGLKLLELRVQAVKRVPAAGENRDNPQKQDRLDERQDPGQDRIAFFLSFSFKSNFSGLIKVENERVGWDMGIKKGLR